MIINNRIAELIVLEQFTTLINTYVSIASGKVYYGMPDEIYVNSRRSASGNVQERRYPAVGIIPIKTNLHYTQNCSIEQQDSFVATGLVRIYTSNILIEQENVLHVETTTKKDHITYKSLFMHFFENLRIPFELTNDVLPQFNETVVCVLKDIEEDLSDAPFESFFKFTIFYKTYEESLQYLLTGYIVCGYVYNGSNPITGIVPRIVFTSY